MPAPFILCLKITLSLTEQKGSRLEFQKSYPIDRFKFSRGYFLLLSAVPF